MATRQQDQIAGATAESRRIQHVVGAICWILGLEWFIGQAIAQAAWKTPYSLTQNYISDLGAATCEQITSPTYHEYVCSPLHDVMNGAFVLLGLLTLVGVVLLRHTWPRRRLAAVGLVFLALFGLGKIVIGFAPEDVHLLLHGLGSLGILCGNLGILLLGLATWSTIRWKAVVSLCVGVVGVVCFVLLFASPQLGVGTLERLADYPLPIWLAALGVMVVLRTQPQH